MLVKQVSIFLENKSGRLAEVTRVLGDGNIDISALSIADTAEYGILRLIVNKPDEAVKVLKDNNFSVGIAEVIAICVNDRPGGLADVLAILQKEGVGIEYMYAFIGKNGRNKAIVIMKVENTEKVIEVLKNTDIEIMSPEELYRL